MKTKWLLGVSMVVAVVGGLAGRAADIGTAFSYQGSLEKPAGTPVTDTCDFRFGLWDDAAAGLLVAVTLPAVNPTTNTGVSATDGVFTTTMDFGPAAFNGAARWMGIEVKCRDDADFVLLSPRVELTPTPYSLRAAEGVGPPNAIEVDPATGEVGIGITDPACKLHVAGGDVCVEGGGYNFVPPGGSAAELAFYRGGTGLGIFRRFAPDHTIFQVWAPPNWAGSNEATVALVRGDEPNVEYIDIYNNGYALETQYGIRMQKRGTGEFRDFVFDYSDGVSPKFEVLRLTPSGNIGIGTTTPAARLDVNGAARTTTLEITGGAPLVPSAVGWGDNTYGQTNVPFDTVTLAAGYWHSLTIRSDGTLAGWGVNTEGQIDVPTGTFSAIAAGAEHSLAISSNGTLTGWGRNFEGQTDVPAGTFIAVAGGAYHSLAVRTDGTLVGWGSNSDGQINTPPGTFTTVAAGTYHSLAIRSDDNTLVGWGRNFYGQVSVPSGTFIAVAAGGEHSLAIRSDGTLTGWGDNNYGQINVPGGTFTAVAAAPSHSLAIQSDGTLVGWGRNNYGQNNVPAGTFIAVAAGYLHDLAIRSGAPTPEAALRLHTDSAIKPGSNTWTIFSDRRLKKNIEPLSGALERLLQLRGVTFQWLDPASQGGITGTQMGLIADEVSRAFPQWVGRDPKGYQTLTVGGFEALTAEALRELRAEKDRQLQEKDCEISDLREEKDELESRVRALEAMMTKLLDAQNGSGR